jgi:hypothetical protein
MAGFARNTGLDPAMDRPRRYLWTDAFAVCTFFGLTESTGDPDWRNLAVRLIGQVHETLGRHRGDDGRTGWISGLPAAEGLKHPTAGGLRIGKTLPERRPSDPFRESEEWDRDGQYFHYLTRWMHALGIAAKYTGDPQYRTWAVDLARIAYARFAIPPAGGVPGRMYWKMSIDLARPLVPSMGQHDPLDGLVTCAELQAGAEGAGGAAVLGNEIAGFAAIGRGLPLATGDPLGIGGLLIDASRIARIAAPGGALPPDLLERVLDAALDGLRSGGTGRLTALPAGHRLAFRECGLAIGLAAADLLPSEIRGNPALAGHADGLLARVEAIRNYRVLKETIEDFWLDGRNRTAGTWQEHRDINTVMLATSLAPAGLLST